MRMMLGLLGATALVTFSLPAAARDGNAVEGRRLFLQENCYICHGGRGGGGMGPNLRDDRPNDRRIRDAVLNGTPTGMPPYAVRLDERDVENLIAYLRSLRDKDEPIFTHWWKPIPRGRSR